MQEPGKVRPFKPSKSILPKNCAVLDTETRGLYGEVELICIKVFRGQLAGETIVITSNKDKSAKEQFQTEILTRRWRGMHFYVHNVEFDLTKLFGNVFTHPDFIVFNAGSRFIKLTYYQGGREKKKNPIHFLDTYNLWVARLGDIGEALGFPKGETPNKFLSDETTGVANWKPETDTIDQKDIDYCLQDCNITQKIVETVADVLTPFRVSLKLTVGACAKAMFKSMAFKDWYNYDTGIDETAREAYYGGRTEVFNNSHATGTLYGYDINSSYPNQMANQRFPDPVNVKKCSPADYEDLLNNMKDGYHEFEGWGEFTIEIPDMEVPPLPYRTDKLIFPTGTITGTWCFPEIRNAIKEGCKIIKCHWIVGGHSIESPFKEFIDLMYAKKSEAKDNGKNAIAELYKRLMNALSGKMGQRIPIMDEIVYNTDNVPSGVPFDCYNGVCVLREVPKERSEETFVQWVAYITSYARVQLHNALLIGKPSYCDTDSVYTDEPFPDKLVDPLELGKWDKEHELDEWWMVSPKRYVYKEKTTQEVTKCMKGVPKRIVEEISFETFGNSQHLEYIKPVKSKTGLRRGIEPYSVEEIAKHIKETGDTKRVFAADGTSKAIKIHPERL